VDLLTEPFQAGYMQRALIEAVLLGVFGGILGVYVVLRHLAFISDALTHTVFPGIAVAFLLDASLYLGAFVAGALSAVLLTVLTRNRRVHDDAALAVLLTAFFSVGVVVVSRSESFSADLTALLFGRILAVSTGDIVQTALTMLVVLVVLAALHKELVLRAFAPESARAMGYRVDVLDLVLNLLITLFVVAAVKAVGTVLVVALVVTPAAAAQLWGRSIRSMMVIAAAIGVVAGWLGLLVSYRASVDHDVRLAPGATIVLVITVVFAVAFAGSKVRDRLVARRSRPGTAPDAGEQGRPVPRMPAAAGSGEP
jgi:manganese/iron transport system permease protein